MRSTFKGKRAKLMVDMFLVVEVVSRVVYFVLDDFMLGWFYSIEFIL